MSARSWLIFILSIWLILVLFRQVFDLIGRLWILVGFNLLQIVCCICGLFGSIQRRFSLLCALAISTVFSIGENVLIMLWYFGIFGDRSKPILAAGLSYSFSFFLRFTPGCEAHFDLNTSKWIQSSSCPVAYYYIEIAQAILHIILGFLTFILATVMLCQRRKEKTASKAASTTYSNVQRSIHIEGPSSVNDLSSGYMNSSYEEVNEIVRPEPLPPPARTVPGRPNFERNSKKKRGKPRPQSMPQPNMDYSSAENDETAVSPIREDFYTKPQKKNANSGRFKKGNENTRRATVHEELSVEGMMPFPSDGIARSASGNMTSLISFDPKSGTLLRVREHIDSEDSDYRDYRRIQHERGVDVGSTYERIRPYEERHDLGANPPLAIGKNKNPSQDSVPSMMAPILTSPERHPGKPESDYGQWAMNTRRLEIEPKNDMLFSPGIRLTKSNYAHSPGIRLSTALAVQNGAYKSSFQVEPRESTRVIGHYHAANEFPLSREEEETQNRPVISDEGSLLV